jgi:hypothetical protein
VTNDGIEEVTIERERKRAQPRSQPAKASASQLASHSHVDFLILGFGHHFSLKNKVFERELLFNFIQNIARRLY